ncbi:C2H2 type zinc finger domain protein [Aspergillus alliaceus]|uniref:C2H2 type zinc finger domain protein n=1 Tax=Petromyces alliaceus TaxID=209559 RepID=A0A5N6FTP5_PETAA|nr:C2H2 type zinc finger domain protein [Aspergillus alliaceus]KAB8232094.1 C2H2 type zinc finger domain protein [Aspergillus alliaceus]KAE8385623.1 C2H2 type zinc finger domain protein [Aspergillus alliaceus]
MSKRSRSISRSPSVDHLETCSRPSSPASSIASIERSKKHLLDTPNSVNEVMHCSLPPHRETLSFPSYDDYEVHYKQTHVNRCAACGKNFPSDRFLNLHIEENHDPLTAAKRERGEKTYGCFIEDCERKCSTPQKRRMHLIDKHMFPKTYNFHIVNDGIDRQTSMLRPANSHRRRISATANSPQEGRLRYRQSSISHPKPVPEQNPAPQLQSDEVGITQLEKSMSALRFIPASVTKSHGRRSD